MAFIILQVCIAVTSQLQFVWLHNLLTKQSHQLSLPWYRTGALVAQRADTRLAIVDAMNFDSLNLTIVQICLGTCMALLLALSNSL